MLKNYLKIAWRSLLKNRLFSFINIFGLALSMSVCMIVMIQIKDQLSFDRFHPFSGRTYRIISQVKNEKNDEWTFASTPLPLFNALEGDSTVVEKSVSLYPSLHHTASYNKKEIVINGAFTTSSFFSVFGFTLSAGNLLAALELPNSIVLSSTTAYKIFGNSNAIGKVLSFDKLGDFIVTGVLNNPPGKSHIDFDAYASYSSIATLEKMHRLPEKLNSWNTFQDAYTYVLLKENKPLKDLNDALSRISSRINNNSDKASIIFKTQSLTDITPKGENIYNEIGKGNAWSKLISAIGIALVVLIAACFNYTNLTIARALTRAKEVGIRKVSGAIRGQIFTQYIIESTVIALFSLAFACVLLAFILKYKPFNDGYELIPSLKWDADILTWLLVFTVFTGCLAGAIPAWILSSFKPVSVLKNITTKKLFGNVSLQKSLIVFQFTLSLVVLIFLFTFYRQFSFMAAADYGFQKENIVTIALQPGDHNVLANEIKQISGVERTSAVSENFGKNPSGAVSLTADKAKEPVKVSYYFVDAGAVPAMKLIVLAGSNFPAGILPVEEKDILLNEQAAKSFAFKSNTEAIGKTIWMNDTTPLQVRGIIKDFYYRGVGVQIAPLALRSKQGSFNYLNVAVSGADKAKFAKQFRNTWNKIYPHQPFTYYWLSKELYDSESQTASISFLGFLAFMTISIASLGLLGLVIYTVETRRKEISIRKIIGARIQEITLLLSKGFIKLLLIAGLIAMPVGYILSLLFLQNFANRVNMGMGGVLPCFFFLLSIGLTTIISQTYRASSENPVKNLRTE